MDNENAIISLYHKNSTKAYYLLRSRTILFIFQKKSIMKSLFFRSYFCLNCFV